jgi:hypothetical protein
MVSIAGTAFAANRNFDDVPRNDWTYGAVNKLLQVGVIDDYDDKTFKGEKIVTRYEMALIIRRAIEKSEKIEKIDIETKTLINKLATEYGSELKDLGVGTINQSAVEDKKANVIDWSGSNFRIRYDRKTTTTAKGTVTSTSRPKDFNYNLELVGHAQFAPGWTAEIRLEGNKDSNGVDNAAADNLSGDFDIEQMFVTGPVGQGTLKVGRFKNNPIIGFVNKEFAEGIRYSFGKVVKTNITWAKNDSKYTYAKTDTVKSSSAGLAGESSMNPGYGTNVASIDSKYSLDKTTDLFTAFYFTNSSNSNYKAGRIFESAFAKKFTPDVVLRGNYVQSNRADNNHAYYASIAYKKADLAKVGSYGWVLEGVRNEAKATIKTDSDIKDYAYDSTKTGLMTNDGEILSSITNGQKGFDIVYQYIPVQNTKFTGRYLYAKPINGESYNHKTQIRLQLEVFFY